MREGAPLPRASQRNHPRMAGQTLERILERRLALADAQLVLAREYGFDTWACLKHHVETAGRVGKFKPQPRFDEAVAAMDAGDLERLRILIASDPALIRARTNLEPPYHYFRWMRTHCAIDLHDAVGFDLREHVEARLREDPASVNKVLDHWGIPRCTPLHWAAWLTIEDVDGEHPHDPAAREELVTLLLEKGPIPTSWPATASRRSMLPAQPVPSESGRCWSGTAASARRTCNPR